MGLIELLKYGFYYAILWISSLFAKKSNSLGLKDWTKTIGRADWDVEKLNKKVSISTLDKSCILRND